MSAVVPAPIPERFETRLVRQSERTLAPELEPGEYVWLATSAQTGSRLGFFVVFIGTMALVDTVLARVSRDFLGWPTVLYYLLVYLGVLLFSMRWVLKTRVLVMTDRRLILLRPREGFPMRAGGRVETQEARPQVRLEAAKKARVEFVGPSCGRIRAYLPPSTARALLQTSIAAWVSR